MSTKITILDNGPILVAGDFEIVDMNGQKIETPEQFAICRCGQSTNQPFCSGAHVGKFESKVSK